MKTMALLILSLNAFLLGAREGEHRLRITSLNIHYVVPGRKKMAWEGRKEAALRVLKAAEADFYAFQEMETFEGGHASGRNIQLDDLLAGLEGYGAAATGPVESFPSTQPILYRRERFLLTAQGFFFFSPSPDVPYSRSWDGGYPAFCSWAEFQDRESGRKLRIYNMHNDYRSRSNRLKTSRLIRDRMAPYLAAGELAILAGDFNALAFQKPVTILREAGLSRVKMRGSSFHFNRGLHLFPAIDHILYSPGFSGSGGEIDRSKVNGVYPSDHYPLSADLYFEGSGPGAP
jgi:endonuclease/exonuclease/phosphatase family metal-dependent hydrolase